MQPGPSAIDGELQYIFYIIRSFPEIGVIEPLIKKATADVVPGMFHPRTLNVTTETTCNI